MKTLGIYLRYSSENQRDNFSLAMQREACARFAEHQFSGWSRKEFLDEAETGLQTDRQGYQATLTSARAGEISAVLCYKYDRLGRSQIDQLLVLEELEEKLGIEVWSATEPRDNVVRGILSVIAEFESRKLGQRLRDAGREAVRQGFAFGRAPYGYRIERVPAGDRTRAKFAVDQERARLVREIFENYVQGKSYRDIVFALNGQHVQGPGGGTWDVSSVQTILHNRAYLGYMVRGRVDRREMRDGTCRNIVRPREAWVVTENAHEPIVPKDLWERVQGITSERAPCRQGVGPRMRYMLSGILSCECGGSFTATSSVSKGKRYWAYYCTAHRNRGQDVCVNDVRLPGAWIEGEIVRGLIGEAQFTDDEIRRVVKRIVAEHPSQVQSASRELADVERKIARANRLLMECPEEGLDLVKRDLASLVERRRILRDVMQSEDVVDVDEMCEEIQKDMANVSAVLSGGSLPASRALLSRIVTEGTVYHDGTVKLAGDFLGCVQLKRGRAKPYATRNHTRSKRTTSFELLFRRSA